MRQAFLIAAMAFIAFAFSTAAYGQRHPTRIKFARGATEKTVRGTLSSWKSKRTFVIRVREGSCM